MLPYTVNSPRFHKGKSGKMRQSNTLLIVGVVTLLLTGLGGLWYIRSKSAHVTGLLAVITEHGKQALHPSLSLLGHRCTEDSACVTIATVQLCYTSVSDKHIFLSCRNKV